MSDFQKLELRVGKVTEVERLEGSDKLVRLEVDLGEEYRTIVAGIALDYTRKQLEGKNIVVLTNLEPKAIMGVVSEGMLLAADVEGNPVLIGPDRDVPTGAAVR